MGERKAFLLRIDGHLYRALTRWAMEELRSVNGQIEFILKEAVRKRVKSAEEAAAEEPPGPGERGRKSPG